MIDLKKVRDKIKMLQTIEQIAADAEMAALLEEVMIDRKTKAVSPKSVKKQPPPKGKPKRGALKAAVFEAARRMERPFSGYQLTDEMVKEGRHQFTAPVPAIAVNDVLRTAAAKKKEIRLHQKGKGSEPNLYVYVKQQNAEAAAGKGSGD